MKTLFTLFAGFLIFFSATAQNNKINQTSLNSSMIPSNKGNQSGQIIPRNCGTMDVLKQQLAKEGKTIEQYKKELELRIKQNPVTQQKAVVTIPVIVHIIHNGSSAGSGINISAAQVQSQLDVLNEDFRRLNADTVNTPSSFKSVAADVEMQFCLATIDPTGSQLNEPGINRVDRNTQGWNAPPYGTSYINNTIKPATVWDRNDYLNIWVTSLSSGLLGYAQFPGQGANTDGVVIGYNYFGSNEKGTFSSLSYPYDEGRTTTHEIGHYFGLYHIWGSGSSCTSSDQVSDTPNQFSATNGCPSSPSSCSSTDMVQNYMDYSYDDCMNLFTSGQKSRIYSIVSSYTDRQSLTTSNKCQFNFAANFTANQTNILVGGSVNFTDLTSGSPNSWSWTFQGGTPTSSSSQNPSGIVYNASGCYDVTLIASDGTSTDTVTKTCYINVSNSQSKCDSAFWLEGQGYYVQPSDSSGFSLKLIDNDGYTPNSNLTSNGVTSDWQVYSETVGSGTNYYLGATSWFDPVNTADNWIIFGPLSIKSSGADLKWEHQIPDNNYRDGYRVMINPSTSGGTINDFNSSGSTLLSYSDNDAATNNNTSWTPQSVNIDSTTYGGSKVYIAFHHNANNQYLLYMDNIRVEQCSTVTVTSVKEQQFNSIKVFPNPVRKLVNIELPALNENVSVSIINMMGKTVYSREVRPEKAGKLKIDMESQSNGIYIIRIVSENMVHTNKILLSK